MGALEDAVNSYLAGSDQEAERYAGYVENEEVGYCRIRTGSRKLKK
jgi:hypothetical protein